MMRLPWPRRVYPTAPADPLVPADPVAQIASPVLPGLDSIRALGAFLVLATHVAFTSGDYSFTLWGTFLSRLDVGVALFFVLSGFLLSRPYLSAARVTAPRPATGHYLWKRMLRIMPPYWIASVLALTMLADNAGATPRDWLRTMTLTDIYLADRMPAGLTQMWSLATELAFYVMLPGIMLIWNAVTRGRRSDGRVLLLVAAAALISVAWVMLVPDSLLVSTPMILQWLPTYGIWFAVGIGLSHLHEHHEARSALGVRPVLNTLVALGAQPGVCLILASALMLIASTGLAGPPFLIPATPAQVVTKTMLYAAIGGLVVLPAAFRPRGVFRIVVEHRTLRHLGHISYGVFCVHILVLHFVMHVTGWELFRAPGLQLLGLTVALSVILAEGLYWFVERPLSRFRNVGRSSSAAAGSAARGASINH